MDSAYTEITDYKCYNDYYFYFYYYSVVGIA